MVDTRAVAGRTVCITGASSGIGRAIAEHLGRLGAHVFMMGRTTEPMAASARLIEAAGGRATVDTFDVTDSERLGRWITGAAETTGRLDVLVNNAGFGDPDSLVDGDPDSWKAMLEVNVLALAVGCQAAVRAMRSTDSEGNIINISSTATLRRDSGMYGATKYAVNCLNGTLREELQDDKIRVTVIKPGVFATNFTRNIDREMVVGLAVAVGVDQPEFDDQGRMPQAQIDRVQAAMSTTIGDVDHIARAVEYVVSQPIEINVEELVIRPQKSLIV
jgi:NADP-dependent 3-hydroxy acid dehydrogenase YdfG